MVGEKGIDARWVNPWAILPRVRERYSGLALRSMPMKTVYDLTVAVSIAVQGILMIASTRAECVRSKRETTCERARIQSRICAAWGALSDCVRFGLNWLTSSSKGSVIPCIRTWSIDRVRERS